MICQLQNLVKVSQHVKEQDREPKDCFNFQTFSLFEFSLWLLEVKLSQKIVFDTFSIWLQLALCANGNIHSFFSRCVSFLDLITGALNILAFIEEFSFYLLFLSHILQLKEFNRDQYNPFIDFNKMFDKLIIGLIFL